jgi:NUDIX domain
VPFISNEEILVIKSYRRLVDSIQIEIPSGYLDKGESPKEAAIRELKGERPSSRAKCSQNSSNSTKRYCHPTEDIAALGIGIDELIGLKAGINQAVKIYNLPPLAATLHLIGDMKKYNRICGVKKELSALYLRKFAIDEAYSRQSEALINLVKLQIYALNEERILQLNNLLENNRYTNMKFNS